MTAQALPIKELTESIVTELANKLKLDSSTSLSNVITKQLESIASSFKFVADKKTSEPKLETKNPIEPVSFDKISQTNKEEPNSLFKILEGPLKNLNKIQIKSAETATTPAEIPQNVQTNDGQKSELEQIDKPKEVIITGFSEQAADTFNFPKIFDKPFKDLFKQMKDGFKELKPKKDSDESGGGSLISGATAGLLGGATLILGGLAALVAAFKTDGEMKGSLEAIGKGGLKGGLVVLAKKLFGATLKTVLKKIPIIGTIISYGFALQRFNNGDTFGGVVDLVSGTVGLLDIVAPGLGTVLSTGVDIFQAVMDAKGGGSSADASKKKSTIFVEWAKKIGKKIDENFKYVPILGPAYELGKAIADGNISEAIKQLLYIAPPLQWLGMIIGDEKVTASISGGLKSAGNFIDGITKWVQEKLRDYPVIGPLVKAAENFSGGEWLKGFKQLAYINPYFEMLGALLGDEETGSKMQQAAGTATNIASKLGNWVADKLKKIPYIGPVIEAIQHLSKGEWKEGLELIPGGKTLYDFFNSNEGAEVVTEGIFAFADLKKWFTENAEKIPYIGPAIKGITLLGKGQIINGLEQLVQVIPGMTSLMAFFGNESALANQADQASVESFDWSRLAEWFNESLTKVPFIGPTIKAIKHLSKGEWKEGLQLIPGGKMLYDFFESKPEAKETLTEAVSIFSDVKKWFNENAEKLPYIGPGIKGIKLLSNGEILAGLEQMVQVIPGVTSLLSFFGNESALQNQADQASAEKFDWSKINQWLDERGRKLPIIGPMIKAGEAFGKGSYLEGLKQLAYIFPPFEIIGSMLGDEQTSPAAAAAGNWIKDFASSIGEKISKFFGGIFDTIMEKLTSLTTDVVAGFTSAAKDVTNGIIGFASSIGDRIKGLFNDVFDSLLKQLGSLVPDAIKSFMSLDSMKNKLKGFFGFGSDENKDQKAQQTQLNKEATAQKASVERVNENKPEAAASSIKNSINPVLQKGDAAIKPDGGLVVSSPKLGALYQLHKQDGIVAAPMIENKASSSSASGNSFGKAEIILEKIAGNTGGTAQNISNLITGFNNLAKALERTLGENARIPMVINTSGGGNEAPMKPTSSQYANAGNGDISSFRTFIEQSRFQPV